MDMHVPEHIYVHGAGVKRRSRSSVAHVSEALTVPERITLDAEGVHIGARAAPGKDSIRNQLDSISVRDVNGLPSVITAAQLPPDESTVTTPVVRNDALLTNSTAIDENPLREIRMMRRCVGNLSVRLLELEEENARRQAHETYLWALVGAAFVTLASLLVCRR